MAGVHVYTAEHQPATDYDIGASNGERLMMRCLGGALRVTDCCRTRRQARNLSVQVYYDCVKFWCKNGKGCQRKAR